MVRIETHIECPEHAIKPSKRKIKEDQIDEEALAQLSWNAPFDITMDVRSRAHQLQEQLLMAANQTSSIERLGHRKRKR